MNVLRTLPSNKIKTPSANEQFGASGGADSSDTERVTSSFALVRALPIPPPDAKPPGVVCKQTAKFSGDFDLARL